MTSFEEPRSLLIADAHGQYDMVANVVEMYEEEVDRFVFLGDVINGPDSFRLIRLIRDMGNKAITIVGNHEWVLRNALDTSNEELAKPWIKKDWPDLEKDMLASYGIDKTSNWERNARLLREEMHEKGDLDWLEGLPAYFETPSYIAVHAGPLLTKPWRDQAADLDQQSVPGMRLVSEPIQIFGADNASALDVPETVDSRTFVTGHYHMRTEIKDRLADRRFCIGSKLSAGDRLYIWLSASHSIHRT